MKWWRSLLNFSVDEYEWNRHEEMFLGVRLTLRSISMVFPYTGAIWWSYYITNNTFISNLYATKEALQFVMPPLFFSGYYEHCTWNEIKKSSHIYWIYSSTVKLLLFHLFILKAYFVFSFTARNLVDKIIISWN